MKPVCLLIPGMLCDAGIWAPVAEYLTDIAEVRMADVARQETIAEMAQDAWRLIPDANSTRPIIVAGFSLGGYVAIEMLAKPVRSLHAVALLSTSARPEHPDGRVSRERTNASMLADFPAVVTGLQAWGMHAPSGRVADQFRQMCLRQGAATGIRQNNAIMARFDHRAALARTGVPIHLLCGRNDRITPPALTEELHALIPRSTVHWVDEAGHMLPVEKPDAVRQVLETLILEHTYDKKLETL